MLRLYIKNEENAVAKQLRGVDNGETINPENNKMPDPESIEQTALRLKNIVEFAKFSYELEDKREQSLINQSGQMLTAFSVASAALLMAIPILIEQTGINKHMILTTAGIVLTLMIISMVFAMVSQWRFKYITMMNGEELLQKIEADKSHHLFQPQYDYQWVDQLKAIQDSKKKNNDKRYLLIHASMIVFFAAVATLVICSIIIALFS